MPSQAIQLQWSLDSTVDNVLKIALKFAQIAASDNVQPFALLACEKFGNTLPICHATRRLVERESLSKGSRMKLSFANAILNQGGGEAITQLSSNVAGLNFLALAAALVSTTGLEITAATIQHIVGLTATQKETIPAEFHVFNILEVLHPRLMRMGFLEKCYQWNWWLSQHEATRGFANHHFPSADGIAQLLSALRSLYRMGDNEADTVVVTSYSCTSWIIAFIEWCTGAAPNICDASGGVILPQPESLITLIIPAAPRDGASTKVELFTISHSLLDTFIVSVLRSSDEMTQEYSGMVSVRCHAQQTFQDLQVVSDLGQRAVMEAVPYALRQAQLLLNWNSLDTSQNQELRETMGIDGSEWTTLRPVLFPTEKLVAAMHAYLGSVAERVKILKDLPVSTVVGDLPILRTWAQESESTCIRCKLAQGGWEEYEYSSQNHLEHHIVSRVSNIAATILVMSLVCTEPNHLRLHYDKNFKLETLVVSDPSEVFQNMQDILLNGESKILNLQDVVLHLKRLIGHGDNHTWQDKYWVASSYRGQVLFPRVLQTMRLERLPCMSMVVIPGVLQRAENEVGARYRAIVSKDPEYGDGSYTTVPPMQVFSPNHFNSLKHEWITRTEGDLLVTSLSTRTATNQFVRVNPFQIFSAIPRLVFAKSCPHEPDKRLESTILDYEFIHPDDFFSVHPPTNDDQRPIVIFATRDNEILRMMILGSLHEWRYNKWIAVIGNRACFACSLELCRRVGSKVLIC